MTGRREGHAAVTMAAFALSAATLVLTLPSLFDAPEEWQQGLAAASGGVTLFLGILLALGRTRRRDVRR